MGSSGFCSLQAHDLADPFRADQLRDVVMSRFERHLADDPLFVVIVDLIDPAVAFARHTAAGFRCRSRSAT